MIYGQQLILWLRADNLAIQKVCHVHSGIQFNITHRCNHFIKYAYVHITSKVKHLMDLHLLAKEPDQYCWAV